MNKTHPNPENKLKGNAYARAYNKVRAYAQSLSWDIRLKNLDGIVELDPSSNGMCQLKYTSPTTGSVALSLNPQTSEITLTTPEHNEYTFPIYSGDNYTDFVRGGVEEALYAFAQRTVKQFARRPRMHSYA